MKMTHLIMLNSLGDSLLVLRGGLNIPGHSVCEWVFLLHYLLFCCKRCKSQISVIFFGRCIKIHD